MKAYKQDSLLEPCGYNMYHKILKSEVLMFCLQGALMCFVNKQQSLSSTALTDWFLSTPAKLQKAPASFVMSVHLSTCSSSASIQIFMKFDVERLSLRAFWL